MVAVAVSLFGTELPQPVSVVVSGLATTDVVTVTRECPGDPTYPVRGGIGVSSSTGTLLLRDVEPQLGRPLVYVATVTTALGVTTETSSAPITVPDPGRHVLSDPYTGASAFVDVVLDADKRENELRASLLRITGRARPVALVDVRDGDTGELACYTASPAETAQLVELLASGLPVASRHPNTGADLPGLETLLVTSATRSRRTRAGDRLWGLSFVVVDSPDPSAAVQLVDLDDLATYYTPGTLDDIDDDYPTLLALALDDLGTA